MVSNVSTAQENPRHLGRRFSRLSKTACLLLALLLIAHLGHCPAAAETSEPPRAAAERSARERHPFPHEQAGLAREAARAASRGEWQEAEKLYRDLVQQLPDHPLARANLGTVLYRTEKHSEALDELEEALRLDPDLTAALQTLGLLYFHKENHYRAISALTRAIDLDPTNSRLHHHLAIVLNDHGWREAAETELRKALGLDPRYVDAHFNLAVIYLERTPPSIELARRHYYRAIELGADTDTTIEAILNPEANDSAPEDASNSNP